MYANVSIMWVRPKFHHFFWLVYCHIELFCDLWRNTSNVWHIINSAVSCRWYILTFRCYRLFEIITFLCCGTLSWWLLFVGCRRSLSWLRPSLASILFPTIWRRWSWWHVWRILCFFFSESYIPSFTFRRPAWSFIFWLLPLESLDLDLLVSFDADLFLSFDVDLP